MKQLYDRLIVAFGALLAVFGFYWMWTGWDLLLLRDERGLASVISGALFLCSGLVIATLGYATSVLRGLWPVAAPAGAPSHWGPEQWSDELSPLPDNPIYHEAAAARARRQEEAARASEAKPADAKSDARADEPAAPPADKPAGLRLPNLAAPAVVAAAVAAAAAAQAKPAEEAERPPQEPSPEPAAEPAQESASEPDAADQSAADHIEDPVAPAPAPENHDPLAGILKPLRISPNPTLEDEEPEERAPVAPDSEKTGLRESAFGWLRRKPAPEPAPKPEAPPAEVERSPAELEFERELAKLNFDDLIEPAAAPSAPVPASEAEAPQRPRLPISRLDEIREEPAEPDEDSWLQDAARELQAEKSEAPVAAPHAAPHEEPLSEERQDERHDERHAQEAQVEEHAQRSTSAVLGRHVSGDTTYIMYADGSIEAQTPDGVRIYASLAELRAHVEGREI